ncbi:M56 family metallopeptidase [Aggregatimonas sangjinii]|uniref:M56 family metallopeptidase n=1 Tax=Aggregatimonas sangjinii TaxID=2583587 RepID=A0A5B7SRX4_9FLAO|nr:M56 family metallopeptidase [Aggregatimonas sangjinii]QCX01307.1 M56 family metallopeptidase [Aggregatimonas sangjinii]
MIQYILEVIAFQLVFLIIYDFWLKRETFFQWNRAYLIGTYLLSMVLPWIKIEALKTSVPKAFYKYPEFLWSANDMAAVTVPANDGMEMAVSWEFALLIVGMCLAGLFFINKLYQLQRLKQKGTIQHFPDFTQVIIVNSRVAFSFLKSIFVGDKVFEGDYQNVIAHELVHIRQRHTYDLLFFEFMRVICWFNPLVYVFQSRISELHEFIADAQVAKTNKEAHFQLLLSRVFETQNISFINQFFKSSLIKKRIVMLQKSQSKRIWKLKYLTFAPILILMLGYTSCEQDFSGTDVLHETISVVDIESLSLQEEREVFTRLIDLSVQPQDWELLIKDSNKSSIRFSKPLSEDSFISGPGGLPLKARMQIESSILDEDFTLFNENEVHSIQISNGGREIPFAVVDEVPIFPGCEDSDNSRACFQEMMQKHISKHFNYPQEAQEKGIQGRVSVMFLIGQDGEISNIRMRGPDKLLEAEVARIISRLPKMTPGKLNGEVVNVPFSIPITFKLQDDKVNSETGQTEYEEIKASQLAEMPEGSRILFQDAIPFMSVAQAPVFPGCEDSADARACFQESVRKHISKNFNYPKEASDRGIQGRVSIMFLISKDGSISSIAKRGPDKLLEDEAVRIISKLPKMKPGKNAKGEPVNVPFSIPITFKL